MSPPGVQVIHLDLSALRALADGDLAGANASSPVSLTPAFVEAAWRSTWRRRAEQVSADRVQQAWVTGVIWDSSLSVAVGRAGFHAAPSDGLLEVGYAVDPAYRRRGYARAALAVLVARARTAPGVDRVVASVSPDNAASLALLRSVGFEQIGEQWDDEDGLEWVFALGLDPQR